MRYSETRLSIDALMDKQLHRSDAIATEIISALEQFISQGQTVRNTNFEDIVTSYIRKDIQADDEGQEFMSRIFST